MEDSLTTLPKRRPRKYRASREKVKIPWKRRKMMSWQERALSEPQGIMRGTSNEE